MKFFLIIEINNGDDEKSKAPDEFRKVIIEQLKKQELKPIYLGFDTYAGSPLHARIVYELEESSMFNAQVKAQDVISELSEIFKHTLGRKPFFTDVSTNYNSY